MSDRLTAWVRTVVPALWSALVAWLITLGVPAGVLDAVGGLIEPLLVPVTLAAVYAGLRWVEPRLPRWLAVALIGSTKSPSYEPVGRRVMIVPAGSHLYRDVPDAPPEPYASLGADTEYELRYRPR